MRNPISKFAYTQSDLGMKRSKFDRTHDHKTTMSAGLLYPILVDEVLPGDTYSVDLSTLVRMSTPIHPVMDDCFLDVYFFFSPNRLVWDHWKEFMGESPDDPYLNPIEYSVPMFKLDPSLNGGESQVWSEGYIPPKSVLDYMGVPSFTNPGEFSQLPVRHFCRIWNEWFRDQNLQNAINFDTGDSDLYCAQINDFSGSTLTDYFSYNAESTDDYVVNTGRGGDLPPVNKYHDYFTSALKSPQKGPAAPIPLTGFAPVYGTEFNLGGLTHGTEDSYPVTFENIFGTSTTGALYSDNNTLVSDTSKGSPSSISTIYFNNLAADLSNVVGTYATISDLRYAFQLQKFLEADGRGGTRYRELLKQHFNVVSPDASQQIPEFLGGKRIPINVSQVLQTSATSDVSPQGNTAAYSLTNDRMSAFTKSFTEHGYLIGVACIRTNHTYGQGLERMWSRKNKFDYYFPEFANISEQPIKIKEIFLGYGDSTVVSSFEETFGYQEAWAEYRYKPNRVSAEFRPQYPQSLDVWHYADDYASMPFLSSEWIRETRKNIDRTLAVNDPEIDQFICDFYFKLNTVRVMPVYSIPGLADHH